MIAIYPHTKCVNIMAYTPDGQLLASVAEDGWVKVWNPAELHAGLPVWEKHADQRGISHAQFTPDGTKLLTSGWAEHVQMWNAKTGELVMQLRKSQGYGGVGVLAVSRDGKRVAFAGGWIGIPEKITVRDLEGIENERVLKGHADACGAMAAGPEGFASGGADKHVKFWSWETGRRYHDLALRGVVRGLVFSPDGTRLAAAGGSVVMVWEMTRPEKSKGKLKPGKLRQFKGHTDQIQCIDFSPDGTTLASAAHDGTIHIWDEVSGSVVRPFAPKVGALHSVAFAPDGLTLAFGSDKGHIGVLDIGG
jgi:WD40 repeat protein